MDYLVKAYCYNGTARIYAAITTDIVKEAQKIHKLWPTSTAALGRVLTIGAIMSCTYKSNEHLTIRLNGDGPIGMITAEVCNGNVRGFVHNPGVYLTKKDGSNSLEYGVGNKGLLQVTKDLNMRAPFTSTAELVSGEIAMDFANYFTSSEQIPSGVGLGEFIDASNNVIAAGGFLLQIMPGCKDEDITRLENRLSEITSVSKMVHNGYTPEDIINEITEGNYEVLETKELKYQCDCNKERFYKGIKSIGEKQIMEIITEDHGAEVTCHFCNKKYTFSEDELKSMLQNDPKKVN